ncbi:Retrovirus-related Pol polyprotein from transposon TNT 1-94 [Gossypium australe]|uniref:Retrovirus-related Pol polyprotein from transposon TNT 1-94 n=1 Tax=Gossypium australe TaxID=47621 RepID=A0A5B6VPE1_9ROSI|nr:Retrovirus-related Pol polyprotein from transposon TNT 1-94 [Gossypium australe]
MEIGLPILEELCFKNSTWRAKEKLQLIHIDLCGPQATPLLNDSRYFIIFIDDFTKIWWIYFMKQKFDVANVFFKYKIWVKNKSGCKIQVVRSDNGTKYTLQRFNTFCDEAGIKHQLTTPYSPQ